MVIIGHMRIWGWKSGRDRGILMRLIGAVWFDGRPHQRRQIVIGVSSRHHGECWFEYG